MRSGLVGVVDRMLSVPAIFELQQRLCNNYSAVREEFSLYLDTSKKEILDIGCSTGACAGSVVSMQDNSYTGIDIDPLYVEAAAKRHPLGTFEVMDARKLKYKDNSFDRILFTGVLHHMDDRLITDMLKEVKRVLRQDGVVLVAEPVFTDGSPLSNFFLRHDRGRFIREAQGYKNLFCDFRSINENFFRFSLHRFCSFVFGKG